MQKEQEREAIYRSIFFCDMDRKKADVIINRVLSDEFPDSVTEVVYAPSQFQPVSNGRINSVKVTAETIRCVDRALDGEDYSNGALYFMNRKASGRKAGRSSEETLSESES